jgi:hypothetical protein
MRPSIAPCVLTCGVFFYAGGVDYDELDPRLGGGRPEVVEWAEWLWQHRKPPPSESEDDTSD